MAESVQLPAFKVGEDVEIYSELSGGGGSIALGRISASEIEAPNMLANRV